MSGIVTAAVRWASKMFVITWRVVNSLGPLCSGSKTIARSAGKSVFSMSHSFRRARSVVQSALRHKSASCRTWSSWSSLKMKLANNHYRPLKKALTATRLP